MLTIEQLNALISFVKTETTVVRVLALHTDAGGTAIDIEFYDRGDRKPNVLSWHSIRKNWYCSK